MSGEDEVTLWIHQLAHGSREAAEALWQAYFTKLVAYARRKMADMSRRHVDEEDVALSALASFCRGVERGRFESLDDRGGLWKLLLTITARKVIAQRVRSTRAKRGGGRVRGESVFAGPAASQEESDRGFGIGDVLSREPTPELAATMAENTDRLVAALDDEKARKIVVLKLEGYDNLEISQRLGCARRTVERKLEHVRELWSNADLA